MTKNPQELARKRGERLAAAINLETPDRIPVMGIGGDNIAEYSGITQEEFAYDYEKSLEAIKKYNADFQFDTAGAMIPQVGGFVYSFALSEFDELAVTIPFFSGPMHNALGTKYFRFPGNEISNDSTPQFIGGTFMEADEYDQLIEDPIGFVANTVVPRTSNNLGSPIEAVATWLRLGRESARYFDALMKLGKISAEQGYGNLFSSITLSPLDFIGDFLRDINNTVLDVRRYPDKVKAANEALIDPLVELALKYKKLGSDLIFIPLHLNEYLSPKLYKEFYWEPLKEIIIRLYDEGMKSFVFFEGHHEPHLETILELPRGWGMAYFEKTDILKAREVLKDNCCVAGGLPISLVVNGPPEKIDSYIKELFEKIKPDGGGFVLAPSITNAPRETPAKNIQAVIDAVDKYGWY